MIRQITLHSRAAAKPALGDPCNGCGACCALEPCPVARLFLLRWQGPCPALLWRDEAARYDCGMVRSPGRFLPWLPVALRSAAGRFFARRIAVASGCDADLEVAP